MTAAKSKDSIIEGVTRGQRLSREDAVVLWNQASFTEIASLAQHIRWQKNPSPIVTYLIDRNINYTNVCNTDCSFCAFYRIDSKHPESYVLSRDQLSKKIEEALELGATRILLQGGHNDELKLDYYLDLIGWIHETYGIELNAFSPSEIHQMTLVSGLDPESILKALKERGLGGLPGGGAEVLDDEVRKRISPKKIRADRWIEIMEVAQNLGLTTTSNIVIGFGETLENRLNHYDRLRDLQDRSIDKGLVGFNLFVSWTHQFNENTSLGRSRWVEKYGVGAVEYLKNAALARIYLDNIQHHQSSWVTCGASIAEIGLQCGSDDIGSTMMEENVVSQAGAQTKNKWFMSPEELRRHIKYAGFTPAQRDSSFNIVNVFDKEPTTSLQQVANS